jgi:hypothetical protein
MLSEMVDAKGTMNQNINSSRNQVRSRLAWLAAMYSASQLDSDTVGCLQETQWRGESLAVKRMPVVETRVSGHCAQSESLYAWMAVVEPGW